MRFSPRVHPFLIEHIRDIDDGRQTVAEIWRDVGREAGRVGLVSPGYHTVRNVVCAERERRAARNEALLIALTEATSRVPDVLRVIDHLAAANSLRRTPP
jgi:hypothetical protein